MVKRRKKQKMHIALKVTLSILAILLTIVIGVGAAGYYYINNMLDKVEIVEVEEENLSIDIEKQEKYGEIRNIALFGVDVADGGVGRSDAIMILTLDTEHNKIKLSSIMRDSYVNIPGYGMDKINHAYAFGGPELAMRTLNENFNLNIKDFMTVNFTSLPIIIDKLGGVDIEITGEELQYINGYISDIDKENGTSTAYINSVGMQRLNGTQATAYARIRYTSGGDYKRTERQRTIINGAFNRVKTIPVTQYPSLVNEFLPFVSTSMNSKELLKIGTDFATLLNNGLDQNRYPLDGQGLGQTINGVYYLTFNIDEVEQSMHNYIFEDK